MTYPTKPDAVFRIPIPGDFSGVFQLDNRIEDGLEGETRRKASPIVGNDQIELSLANWAVVGDRGHLTSLILSMEACLESLEYRSGKY